METIRTSIYSQAALREGNTQMLKFLGYRESTKEEQIKWLGCKTEERLANINPNYIPVLMRDGHEHMFPDGIAENVDYNFLMAVVEKIEYLGYYVTSFKNRCTISPYSDGTYHIVTITSDTRINALWLACVEYLNDWYGK